MLYMGKKNKQKHSLDAPQNTLHVKRWAVHGKSVKCMPDAKTHQQVKEKTCKAYVRCMPTNTARGTYGNMQQLHDGCLRRHTKK